MGFIIGGSRNGSMIKEINCLQVVSLAINDTCNLRCRHCYLQTAQTQISILSDHEWLYLADSLFTYISPSVLAFVGKEPLLNFQSVKLISAVIQLRDTIQTSKHNRTDIGLLTNGMSLLRFSDILLANPPDYLDISVDGLVFTCKNKLNIVNFGLFHIKGVYNGKKSSNTLLLRE
ncbi:MAG: radical SAM protein [Planctomycetia bacterium]|nr:radical SAM protein [Planctomycetia bacterium]